MHNYASAFYELTSEGRHVSNKTVHLKGKANCGEEISLTDDRWQKTAIRSTRLSPALMDMIKAENANVTASILATKSVSRLRQP